MTRSDASITSRNYKVGKAEHGVLKLLLKLKASTAEATTGGLHSIVFHNWMGKMVQVIPPLPLPPNEIAWAEEVKGAETKIFGIGLGTLALGALGIFGVKKLMDSKKDDTASGSDTKNAEKDCGCAKTVKKSVSVKESEYSSIKLTLWKWKVKTTFIMRRALNLLHHIRGHKRHTAKTTAL